MASVARSAKARETAAAPEVTSLAASPGTPQYVAAQDWRHEAWALLSTGISQVEQPEDSSSEKAPQASSA